MVEILSWGLPEGCPKVARRLPEGARRLPEGARRLPEGARRLPEGARRLPEGCPKVSGNSPQLPEGCPKIAEVRRTLPNSPNSGRVAEFHDSRAGQELQGASPRRRPLAAGPGALRLALGRKKSPCRSKGAFSEVFLLELAPWRGLLDLSVWACVRARSDRKSALRTQRMPVRPWRAQEQGRLQHAASVLGFRAPSGPSAPRQLTLQ
jgi:hypothetical protein